MTINGKGSGGLNALGIQSPPSVLSAVAPVPCHLTGDRYGQARQAEETEPSQKRERQAGEAVGAYAEARKRYSTERREPAKAEPKL